MKGWQKDRETKQGDICFPTGPQRLGVWREFLSSIHKDGSDFLKRSLDLKCLGPGIETRRKIWKSEQNRSE